MDGDIAARALGPLAGARRTRKAHRLGERGIDLAGHEVGERAVVACPRLVRRTVGAMDGDQRAEAALDPGPQPLVGRRPEKLRLEVLESRDQLRQAHRRAGRR